MYRRWRDTSEEDEQVEPDTDITPTGDAGEYGPSGKEDEKMKEAAPPPPPQRDAPTLLIVRVLL